MDFICFDNLKKNLTTRNQRITDALKACREECERVTAIYAPELASEKEEQAKATARAAIVAANRESHDAAAQSIDVLRHDLKEEAGGGADPALLARLQTAKAFGLKLTRLELEGMARDANGDAVALAALAQVAKESGFLLTYTSTTELEKDLTKLSHAFPEVSQYAPAEYAGDALQLLPDVIHHGANFGRPTPVQVATAVAFAESSLKYIDEARDRWANRKEVTLDPIVLPQSL